MNFSVSLSSSIDSIIIQDDAETIFHIELPNSQNTISGWTVRFTYLRKTQPQELHALLGAIPQLLEIQVDDDAHPTYLPVVCGRGKSRLISGVSPEQFELRSSLVNGFKMRQNPSSTNYR